MAQGTLSPSPKLYGWNNVTGAPLAGGLLYTVSAGGDYPGDAIATYTDVDLTTPNANPIVLNSAGYCVIYLTPGESYKFILYSSVGGLGVTPQTLQWTQDNITTVPTTSGGVDVDGTAGEPLASGMLCYVSDGSGGRTNGLWYLADADLTYGSSSSVVVGFATSTLALNAAGQFRTGGRMVGLSGLTSGSAYYASATAGLLTSTAPTNRRLVGIADSTTSLVMLVATRIDEVTAYLASAPTIAIGNDLTVGDDLVTTGDVTVGTDLIVTGDASVGDDLTVTGTVLSTEIRGPKGTTVASSINAGIVSISLSSGDWFEFTVNANWDLAPINTPLTGTYAGFYLVTIGNGSDYTDTGMALANWPGGVTPTVTTTNGRRDIYLFIYNATTPKWYGFVVGQNIT